jgi:uncharacterized SAM-dependent methyltransferase
MSLVSRDDQRVRLGNDEIELARGERIRTEYSYKYTVPQFSSLARSAGLTVARTWTDAAGLFSVQYLVHSPG